MKGGAILEAVRRARENLEAGVAMSRRFRNQSGLVPFPYCQNRLELTEHEGYVADMAATHEKLSEAYHTALDELREAGYAVPSEWRDVALYEPQIAYSELPIVRVDGRRTKFIWVIGSAPVDWSYGSKPLPDELLGCVSAGEVIGYGKEHDESDVPGAFNETVVRQWAAVLSQIEAAEQRLVERQLTWKTAAGDSDNAARDKWMHDEKTAGQTLTAIKFALAANTHGWDVIDTEQGISQAIKRYRERERLNT